MAQAGLTSSPVGANEIRYLMDRGRKLQIAPPMGTIVSMASHRWRIVVLVVIFVSGLAIVWVPGVVAQTEASPNNLGGAPSQTAPTKTVTVSGFTASVAPGMPRAGNPDLTIDFPRNVGQPPTERRCVSEWNAHAPSATIRWLAPQTPRPAHVRVASFTRGGSTSFFCSVEIALRKDRVLMAFLYKPNGGSLWRGVVFSPMSKLGLPPGQFDVSIGRNGKIQQG